MIAQRDAGGKLQPQLQAAAHTNKAVPCTHVVPVSLPPGQAVTRATTMIYPQKSQEENPNMP